MGGCVSSSSCESSSSFKHVIRVVHIDGYVEDFVHPITVSQVVGDPPLKHLLYTTLDLLSSSSKPLNPHALLQPGQVYFKLPCSLLHADFSPLDLASLAKRLTAVAKSTALTSRADQEEEEEKPRLQLHDEPSRGGGRGLKRRRSSYCYGVRVRPWKPMLDTIKESPLSQRIE